MNTQPQYIKIALLVGIGLLVLITCIGSYMLYSMEYDDTASVQVGEIPQTQNQNIPQGEVVPSLNDTNVSELPPIPPPSGGTPTAAEMEALYVQHEIELKAAKENPPVPTSGVITEEQVRQRISELQNTPPTTPQ